ncbi:endonuclease VII domain-containing protein [Streptomyces sp. NPDC018019]|uniref:endonuclease VII domain-containing protein n=1 Tax=Streptomyces sp. NPDC018019 TaxID=3365030 RepID=UPI0037BD9AB2
MAAARRCKDCPPGARRPAPHPGPRCATHHRAENRRRREAAHERSAQRTYGLGPGEYARLYAVQGGRCAICRRATGATRRLSIDHNHRDGAVRGLLCRPCNSMLGHARDSVLFFSRAMAYLGDPPARQLKEGGDG